MARDAKQSKSKIDALFESLKSNSHSSRRYRNGKHVKRSIESAPLRRILGVNIRFPVVKFLRTDEDTYATLICEMPVPNLSNIDIDNSLVHKHSDSAEESDSVEDEDWDNSDKRYTIRVKPPPEFLSRLSNPTGSPYTTTTTAAAVDELSDNSTSVEQVEDANERIASFSKRRLDYAESTMDPEEFQGVRTSLNDSISVETTTATHTERKNSSQVYNLRSSAEGNLTSLAATRSAKLGEYLQVLASSPTEARSNLMNESSSTSTHEPPQRSQTPTSIKAINSLARERPSKRAETNYLNNFIVSTVSSLLILTFVFAVLVMDTCADEHTFPTDISGGSHLL